MSKSALEQTSEAQSIIPFIPLVLASLNPKPTSPPGFFKLVTSCTGCDKTIISSDCRVRSVSNYGHDRRVRTVGSYGHDGHVRNISLRNGYGHDRHVLAVRNYGHDVGRVRNTDLFWPKPPSTRVLPVRPSELYSSPRPDLNRPDMFLSCIFSIYAYTTLSS